jgi:hypothetical protein
VAGSLEAGQCGFRAAAEVLDSWEHDGRRGAFAPRRLLWSRVGVASSKEILDGDDVVICEERVDVNDLSRSADRGQAAHEALGMGGVRVGEDLL